MSDFLLKSVSEYSLADSAALFTNAFTGYIAGNIRLNATALAGLIAGENVDMNASRVLVHGEEPVGFGLISRQGWTNRVAAMGIIPEMQGKGAGRWLLENLQAEARARNEKIMVLEAFEQNTPAVALYSRLGFQIVRRLYGYTKERLEAESADIQEIDPFELGKRLTAEGVTDLPWQVSGATTMRAGFPSKAFQLGHAYATLSLPSETVALRVLFVSPVSRRQGQASRLLRGLAHLYPDRKWTVPQLCPEEYGGFFERQGFQRVVLNQVQMACSL